MGTVVTVMGEIDSRNLGFTSMHEHILVDCRFFKQQYGSLISVPPKGLFPAKENEPVSIENLAYLKHGYMILSDDNCNLQNEELMTAEINDYQEAGGSAILEVSAPGIRRNIEGIQRISRKTGIHIVASTGLYAEGSWPKIFREMNVDEFSRYMKREVEDGIEGTDIRAGHIKVAVNGITPKQLEFLKAVAIVSNETGASVTMHLGYECNELDSRRAYLALLDAGQMPERLLMCHMHQHIQERNIQKLVTDQNSWKPKLDYVLEVLDKGINICIDCFGLVWDGEPLGFQKEADTYKIAALYSLIKRGYSKQIVIGNDVFVKIMTRRYGGDGYCRIISYVIPTLKALGISEKEINSITIENPARILSLA